MRCKLVLDHGSSISEERYLFPKPRSGGLDTENNSDLIGVVFCIQTSRAWFLMLILPEMSLLVYMYMTTGGQERGSEGGRRK